MKRYIDADKAEEMLIEGYAISDVPTADDDLITFQSAKAKIIADRDEIEKELKRLPRNMAAQYKRLYYDGIITGLCWALGDMADIIKKQNKGA